VWAEGPAGASSLGSVFTPNETFDGLQLDCLGLSTAIGSSSYLAKRNTEVINVNIQHVYSNTMSLAEAGPFPHSIIENLFPDEMFQIIQGAFQKMEKWGKYEIS
jgi:hypothetical protein